jgi:hypothetical protein
MMLNTQKSDQIEAAERLVRAARELHVVTTDIPHPSDSNAILASLEAAQEAIDRVYMQMADWHGRAVQGVHHAGEKVMSVDPRNTGWIRAEVALQEAARYGADALDALERAQEGNESALWFDEVIEDEG